jgi:hypothetical protein
MRPFNVETLMDHSLGISDHYGRPMEQDLFSDYLKVVEALTINKQIEFKEVAENQQSTTPVVTDANEGQRNNDVKEADGRAQES